MRAMIWGCAEEYAANASVGCSKEHSVISAADDKSLVTAEAEAGASAHLALQPGELVESAAGESGERLRSHAPPLELRSVLTTIVGAMVTTASVDYERLEACVNFAAKHYRPGHRPALLGKAASILHDLGGTQKALVVENRKGRNDRKRSWTAPLR